MATIDETRNKHKPVIFMVEFECEERRQFELTEEALECLQKAGHLPDVDETLGLTRPEWKKAREPKSSGTTWGFSNKAQTIGKSQL